MALIAAGRAGTSVGDSSLTTTHDALLGDVFGGLTAALVALPSAIAFGLLIYAPLGSAAATTGVMAGILGAIAIGVIAPAFGGTKRLVSAPCAPAAAVMGALALELTKPGAGLDPAAVPLLLALVAGLAACLQILFGLIGGGRLIKYIPYPVVAGYLSGVGVLIILGQLPKFLGLAPGLGLWQGLMDPSAWQWPAIGVGLAAIAVMLFGARLTAKVPVPILALAGGCLAYFAFAWARPELRSLVDNTFVIGPIGASSGIGEWFATFIGSLQTRVSGFASVGGAELRLIIWPTLTLAVLLSIDTLKTCVVIDALTRSRHDSNRELRGQGLGNLASALIGGMPGAGTMGATLVNLNSGGQTRRSGILVGVFSALIFLVLGRLVAWVPLAALAGILIVVGIRMIDRQSLALLRQKSTIFDFAVIAAVVVTAVTVNLMAAAGVGVLLAIGLFLRDQIRGSVILHKSFATVTRSKKKRLADEMKALDVRGEEALILRLQGALFFGTTDQLFSEVEAHLPQSRFVLFDLRRVRSVDFTAIHMMEQIEARIGDVGGWLVLTSPPAGLAGDVDLRTYLSDLGLIRGTRRIRIFATFDDGLEWIESRILDEAKIAVSHDRPPLELGEIQLLSKLAPDALEGVRACVEERSYREGEKIFRSGDHGDELFMIRKGEVKIDLPIRGGKCLHLATFGRGDFFGDMAFLDANARSADAVAMRATEIFVLSRARFDLAVRANPAVGAQVFADLASILALRLRYTDAELRSLEEV